MKTHAHQNEKPTVKIAGAEVSRTCHACAFFHSRDEYYEVLLPFIKEGLKLGDKTLHIVESKHHEDHINRLEQNDIATDHHLQTGQLEIKGWTETYLSDGGKFNQDKMLDMVTDTLAESKAKGFSMSRLVGNMEWACTRDAQTPGDLVRYELRLNEIVAKFDAILVCCYDINQHGSSVIMDVLRTHPYVIIGGTMHVNPYFVKPEELLAEVEAREARQQTELIN